MKGWAKEFQVEMNRIPDEISKIFNSPSIKEGTYVINLVFRSPENINDVLLMMRKFSQ